MEFLPEISPPHLHLVLAPRPVGCRLMTALTAHLAQSGHVHVLDGGNSFDGYGLARQLRHNQADVWAALGRVAVARGFTCYQMITLLRGVSQLRHEGQRQPTLVLNLLDAFYDENVLLEERRRLLVNGLEFLCALSRRAPVAVSASPPAPGRTGELIDLLAHAAGQVWEFELLPPPAAALRLFEDG